MTEDSNPGDVATFAYYLPQFYPMPLNGKFWGDGFTEWTAVMNAQRGNRSPGDTTITPGRLGFYDLRLRQSRVQQGELARQHGLSAFCVYHYYSRGDRVMPDIVDLMLKDGAPDFPFFFCWANHDWNLAWKGQPEVVTWPQEYDAPDDDTHFEWLSAAFDDPRYYRIGGAPVLAVYAPEKIPKAKAMFDRWRAAAVEHGLPGLVLLGFAHQSPPRPAEEVGLDAWIQGAAMSGVPLRKRVLPSLKTPSGLLRFLRHGDYRIDRRVLTAASNAVRRRAGGSLIPQVQSSWNNVGRRTRRASYLSVDVAQFEADLRRAFADAPIVQGPTASKRLVAINAWNEWGEAMAMEPTEEHGLGMLEALRRVVDSAT